MPPVVDLGRPAVQFCVFVPAFVLSTRALPLVDGLPERPAPSSADDMGVAPIRFAGELANMGRVRRGRRAAGGRQQAVGGG